MIYMTQYVVNDNRTQNPGFHHEVHTKSHATELRIASYTDLGYHANEIQAVAKAKTIYSDADGCAQCCPKAHTG
jgi:hypothetical protein